MDGPSIPGDAGELLDSDDDTSDQMANGDKEGYGVFFSLPRVFNFPFFPACIAQLKEKELNHFMSSVLSKTSKLHQLAGELQSKYSDPRASECHS